MKFLSINGKRINANDIISDIKGQRYKFQYLCDGERKLFCETADDYKLARVFYPSVFNAIILEDDVDVVPKDERVTTAFNRSKVAEKYGDKDDI